MDKLRELDKVRREAWEAKYQVEQEISALRQAREEAFRKELAAEVKMLFGDKLNAAAQTLSAAVKACEDEAERVAMTGEHLQYPVGTKLFEWKTERWGRVMRKTGKVGVTEIFTRESVVAGNVPSYRVPAIGKEIIRLLKKDGTPSSKFDLLTEYSRFYPEGVDPNEARK